MLGYEEAVPISGISTEGGLKIDEPAPHSVQRPTAAPTVSAEISPL